jgi:hypothetical protein
MVIKRGENLYKLNNGIYGYNYKVGRMLRNLRTLGTTRRALEISEVKGRAEVVN